MISEEIKQEPIKYDRWGTKNINELIELFETDGDVRLRYLNYEYHIMYERSKEKDKEGNYIWKPSIREHKQGWTPYDDLKSVVFYESWDDLIEQFTFPNGEKLIDVLFTKNP